MNDNTPPPPGTGPPGQPRLDAGEAVSYGWSKFTTYAGVAVAVVLIPFLVQLVISGIGQLVVDSSVVVVLVAILSFVASLVLGIGYFNLGLMVTRGETPEIGKAYSSDRWGEWVVFAFVFGLMIGVGALFCLVGALVVVAFWGLAPFYFIDQRMSLGQALSASLDKTRSTPGLPVALALTALIGWIGVFACGVGLLVTLPVAYMGSAYLYRVAMNQAVA